jgi:hypothetical protein
MIRESSPVGHSNLLGNGKTGENTDIFHIVKPMFRKSDQNQILIAVSLIYTTCPLQYLELILLVVLKKLQGIA